MLCTFPCEDHIILHFKVTTKWALLKEEVAKKKLALESATEAFQFFSDCNETESIIKEFITLAKSKDFGQDKLTALSLLGRHKHLQDKIQSIEPDVSRVSQAGDKLVQSNLSSEALYLATEPAQVENS